MLQILSLYNFENKLDSNRRIRHKSYKIQTQFSFNMLAKNSISFVIDFEVTFYKENCKCDQIRTYLIFVIFLHEQNFWRIKFTPKKRVNCDKIDRKLPIFLRYCGKIHSKLPIFRVKSIKNLHRPKKVYTRILVALVTNIRYG